MTTTWEDSIPLNRSTFALHPSGALVASQHPRDCCGGGGQHGAPVAADTPMLADKEEGEEGEGPVFADHFVIRRTTTVVHTVDRKIREFVALWKSHVDLTFLFVVGTIDGRGGAESVLGALRKNQTAIASQFGEVFGDPVRDIVERLLLDHINGAAAILLAAITVTAQQPDGTTQEQLTEAIQNDAAVVQAVQAWNENGVDIATGISALDETRRIWPEDALKRAIQRHLNLTIAYTVRWLVSNLEASLRAYQAASEQAQKEIGFPLARGMRTIRRAREKKKV